MLSSEFIHKFTQVAKGPDLDLAPAALLIARLEYPRLDASHYLQQLDQMGLAVTQRLKALSSNSDVMQQIKTLNNYLFEEKGFSGNQEDYDNPRNSYLNEVLERRTGIPITLALNAGFNNIDLIVAARNSQPSSDKYVCLDYINRKLSSTKNPKIIESSYMKRQMLITATEAANSILRINDVYHGKSK